MKALERLYRRRVPFDRWTTPELTRSLCEVSAATSRQVGVLVDRSGTIHFVIVGDASGLYLPDIGRLRAGPGRLRGLRLIHTHLNNEPLTRDDLVDLTRLRLDLIVAICLGPGLRPTWVYYGHNVPVEEGSADLPYQTTGPLPYSQVDLDPAQLIPALEQEFNRIARARTVVAKDGRAILVHVCDKRASHAAAESLRELDELARTAGVEVCDRVVQVRERVDPKYVLGRGKLEDVVIRAMQRDAEVLIFDRDLSPAQAAGIARMTDLKVLDRTQLILDIFAQRAQSRDGKLQVELAQMKYLLPRLGAKDDALSRLTGGIGGRGPGETKLEIGRRRARDRITRLNAELRRLSGQRRQRRARRQRSGVAVIAIVGYTNAGKSTLLNALTGSDVLAEDKLFATLDPRSRRMSLGDDHHAVLTDTVGFIRELPKDLFAAFRATFEEAQDADLLLHVVDCADASSSEHVMTTEKLLAELELERIPRLLIYNKVDLLESEHQASLGRGGNAILVSALEPSSLQPLREAIVDRLRSSSETDWIEEPLDEAEGNDDDGLDDPVDSGG